MESLQPIQDALIWIIPIIFAITVHEAAHGYVAHRLGDQTAFMLGRVTLNPIKHISLIGTIIVPLALYLTAGLPFGWAKPVPVNTRNLGHYRRDTALVAAAGPLSNLVMALFWGLILKLGIPYAKDGVSLGWAMVAMGNAGVIINLVLAILNMIPIPPLDGSRVMSSLLPRKIVRYYDAIEPYGLMIVIGLMFAGVLNKIIAPGVYESRQQIFAVLGIPH